MAFFFEIEGKVIFASARSLPWVLPVACDDQSMRFLQWRLCFGDAFVYGARSLCYHLGADMSKFDINVFTMRCVSYEC